MTLSAQSPRRQRSPVLLHRTGPFYFSRKIFYHIEHHTLDGKTGTAMADDDGFHLFIRRLKADLAAFLEERFERHVALVEERDDLLTIICRRLVFYDDDVAIVDVFVDHAVADNPQGKKFA